MNTKSRRSYDPNRIETDLTSLTYTGLFNSSLFEFKHSSDKILSINSQAYTIVNPISLNTDIIIENLITSKYDGKGFREGPIDLSICLDISGSMDGPNLIIAKRTLKHLLDILTDEDSLALSVFDDSAETIHKLTRKTDLDIKTELTIIESIQTRGGTNLYSGIAKGIELLQESQIPNKRIIFITDMCSVDNPDMEKALKDSAFKGMYTSIIGIGTDFNTSLTEKFSKIKGLNYFSVNDVNQLKEIVIDEFKYNFFPNAFDLELSIKSGNFKLVESIGGGDDIDTFTKEASESWTTRNHSLQDKLFKSRVEFLLMLFKYRLKRRLPKPILANFCDFLKYGEYSVSSISTAFPSKLESIEGKTFVKGGLLIQKLEKLPESCERICLVSLKYKDPSGQTHKEENLIDMDKIPSTDSKPTIGYALYSYGYFMRSVMDARSKNDRGLIKKLLEKGDSIKDILKGSLKDKKELARLCEEVESIEKKIKLYLDSKDTK